MPTRSALCTARSAARSGQNAIVDVKVARELVEVIRGERERRRKLLDPAPQGVPAPREETVLSKEPVVKPRWEESLGGEQKEPDLLAISN